MTDEEIETWFRQNGGRVASVTCTGEIFTVYVSDSADTHLEGEGEGESLNEALSEAIFDYQRYVCGAI